MYVCKIEKGVGVQAITWVVLGQDVVVGERDSLEIRKVDRELNWFMVCYWQMDSVEIGKKEWEF